ncbi:antibiotic biosynthesis monooxygenase family protein [Streptomyces sp. NPDC052396]|uniref:antibiotic biosynthesis monooxygenase family protein n=1 Tax=Streptomyces sp. NPDC052396 TaxID=3365689 RepID=UPI0037CE9CF7
MFTVINTFTLKNPEQAAEFEGRFLEHVEWMRAQEGFIGHQAVRLAERPEVYVNLGWWREPGVFQAVLASETFQAHAKEFHQLVEVVADPSMNAVTVNEGHTEGEVIVVEHWTTEAEAAEFEAAYRAYAEAAGGFTRLDLSRALMRPGAFTATTWWPSEDAYAKATAGEQYAAVAKLGEVRAERAVHVARNAAPAN